MARVVKGLRSFTFLPHTHLSTNGKSEPYPLCLPSHKSYSLTGPRRDGRLSWTNAIRQVLSPRIFAADRWQAHVHDVSATRATGGRRNVTSASRDNQIIIAALSRLVFHQPSFALVASLNFHDRQLARPYAPSCCSVRRLGRTELTPGH